MVRLYNQIEYVLHKKIPSALKNPVLTLTKKIPKKSKNSPTNEQEPGKAMFAIVGSRAREGYGSVRERDVGDGGRVPEREAPISNTSIQRRPNGKMSASQPVQQQPVQVNSLISVNP